MKGRVLSVLLGGMLAGLMGHALARAGEPVNGYIIPAGDQYEASAAVVNRLLEEAVAVYRAAEPFSLSQGDFERGDYVVSVPDVADDFVDDIARAYVRFLAHKYQLTLHPFSAPFTLDAYRLHDTNVAVYFGRGTSGGALWHIDPAQRTQFDVGVLLESDIQNGAFAEYDAVSFPSGGFYSGYIGEVGNNNLRQFIAEGGGFFGTCGGAVYGVELEMLDVMLDREGLYPAAADLRGPIVLSNASPAHPVLYGFGATFNPSYWVGQNFEYTGAGVTVLSRYVEATPLLEPYDPAISRAYGYYPNTEIINRFWGRPAAVAGDYALGKVVLTGTHPEYYPQTEKFLINTLFQLNSEGPFVVDVQSLGALDTFVYRDPGTGGPLDTNPVSVIQKLAHFKGLSIAARLQLATLDVENEAITNAVGEFIVTFLDDQIERSSALKVDVLAMASLYGKLVGLRFALDRHRPDIPVDQYALAVNRIEHAQAAIAASMRELDTIDALNTPSELILERMVQHREDLVALLLLRSREGESAAFYQGVIDLFGEENDTLQLIKLGTAYHVLNGSFAADKAIKHAEFASVLAVSVLASR